jgi:hypothetical protein
MGGIAQPLDFLSFEVSRTVMSLIKTFIEGICRILFVERIDLTCNLPALAHEQPFPLLHEQPQGRRWQHNVLGSMGADCIIKYQLNLAWDSLLAESTVGYLRYNQSCASISLAP